MQYAAWVFFLLITMTAAFIFAPDPEDTQKTEEAVEDTSGDVAPNEEEAAEAEAHE